MTRKRKMWTFIGVDIGQKRDPTAICVAVPEVSLGKAFLVSRLQALLQTRRLHLPRSPEAEALAQELLDYEIRVDENANDRYGAFRVGTHDDLVTALGLAVQSDRPAGFPQGGALPYSPGAG